MLKHVQTHTQMPILSKVQGNSLSLLIEQLLTDLFEMQDMTPYQAEHALARLPSPLQFLSYVFCLGNLLAGPAVEYAEYEDFIEHKGVRGEAQDKEGSRLAELS